MSDQKRSFFARTRDDNHHRPNKQSRQYHDSNPTRSYFRIDDQSTARFFIHPYSMYNENFPVFTKPQEVGFMLSHKRQLYVDAENREKDDDSKKINGLRYLGIDLFDFYIYTFY